MCDVCARMATLQKTPADIVFDDVIKDTVLFHTANNDIIIFGSSEMVKNASAVQMISIDGTFSRCPETHFQLVTSHAVCNDGVSFPFAFALLPNKKSSNYVKTFCELDNVATKECGRRVFGRRDVVVSCDFESGLLKALGHFACNIKCCHFHTCQSIWRFVTKHGLASRYYTDTSFRVRVRYLMMLPLLPHDKIVSAFRELKQYFPETDDGLWAVYCHFNDVWVNGFPVVIWCQYNELNRTNNVAEAFHSILARRLMKHHPHFPTFHAHIATLIAESVVKFNSHRTNPKSTTHAKELLNSKLRTLVKNYLSGPPLALPWDQLLEVLFIGSTRKRVLKICLNAIETASTEHQKAFPWSSLTSNLTLFGLRYKPISPASEDVSDAGRVVLNRVNVGVGYIPSQLKSYEQE